ncbi:hypothetical protein CAPI_06455 [Corynebacterium capitovis DSM 44611]|uniref:DUF2550 domain-containing protein n=1 Tax=Corynebacterium capitovis TaxID=131081 RepID=UPI0003634F70|nr:DUF2550 domain-containing protein [Corynebacterium capitovis]WKD57832.1 hypothetical protein CAPI_06455 [Corynebacterium capitovis DSM 44611]
MEYVGIAAVVALVLAAAAALWRFTAVRRAGAPGLFRWMPATGVHGWRHGVLHYSGDQLEFYKVRSLSPSPDLELNRRDVELGGLRDLTAEEIDIMPGVSSVLQFSTPAGKFEFAAAQSLALAFISWVESAPDRRQEPRAVRNRGKRATRGHREH